MQYLPQYTALSFCSRRSTGCFARFSHLFQGWHGNGLESHCFFTDVFSCSCNDVHKALVYQTMATAG
jgi:hypothetical protein